MKINFIKPVHVIAFCFLFSFSSVLAAWVWEIWGGLRPCTLCLYQRYGLMAIGFLSLIGLFRRKIWDLKVLSLGFFLNSLLAFFHVSIEQKWIVIKSLCGPQINMDGSLDDIYYRLRSSEHIPCDQVPWELWGISMAGYNSLCCLAMAFLIGIYVRYYIQGGHHEKSS
jgi:disulfide bond formation protein DsbB